MERLVGWCFFILTGVASAMPAHTPVPGGIAIVRLGAASHATESPAIHFQGRRVLVVRNANDWLAIVGIPLDTKPGTATLEVEGSGERPPVTHSFVVAAKQYPVQKLTISDHRKVDPQPEDMKRILREQEVITKVRTHWAPGEAVDLALMLPADAPLSSRFGLRRVLNGQSRNPHNGLDLAVPRGTPIRSTAAGSVTFAGDLFFAGKTVFVDHGQGLISMYAHLDEIGVRVGEQLARGQRLGLSGMTGRVTGPHLHWTIYLNGTAVDPEYFIRP
ncbi:MAG: M23 family metallopeptidase [Betaproteobacteria bacterium]|nr:M23 family metallopeptidase [Betaproteobacteria bacterium]